MREKISTIIGVTILILMIAFVIGVGVKFAVDEDFRYEMKDGYGRMFGYDDTADIAKYILSDTEDQGDYIISITRASAKVAEYPNARFYFVEFIDADGDYEHLIVRVDKDGIHEFAVEE